MVPLSSFLATLSLPAVQETVRLGEKLVSEVGNAQDRDAARLLQNSQRVFFSMAAYGNECRKAYVPLLRFSGKWPSDEKEGRQEAVDRFVMMYDFFPMLQGALPSLKKYVSSHPPLREDGTSHTSRLSRWVRRFLGRFLGGSREQNDAVSRLTTAGEQYLVEVMERIRKKKEKWHKTIGFLPRFRGSDDKVVRHADEVLALLRKPGQALFADANVAYWELEDEILRRHPSLWQWRKLTLGQQGLESQT